MDEFADDNEISMNANFEENDELRQNGEIENNQELEAGEREGESEDMNPNEGNNFEQMEKTTDDEERKLFLGGLSWDTNEQDLRNYFSKHGQVADVSIKYDACTGNPRGFGFITFSNESAIDTVLKSGPHVIRNKTIDPKRAKSRPICKKIFVGGVDASMSEDDLKKYFSKFGPVEGIELPYDRQRNRRREFCFIIFDTEEAAEEACKEPKQIIGNKECDIKKAQPQPVAQQQKRMQQQQSQGYWDGNYDGSSSSSSSYVQKGKGKRGANHDQSQEQWAGYNGQNYYQNYYGTNQYPNAYSASAYPGYDYYGQYYGYGAEYWNYYGYGDGSTADYSQSATRTDSTGYASAQSSSQSSTHSHHVGSSNNSSTGGKMTRKTGSNSNSNYHPYRSTSGH